MHQLILTPQSAILRPLTLMVVNQKKCPRSQLIEERANQNESIDKRAHQLKG